MMLYKCVSILATQKIHPTIDSITLQFSSETPASKSLPSFFKHNTKYMLLNKIVQSLVSP